MHCPTSMARFQNGMYTKAGCGRRRFVRFRPTFGAAYERVRLHPLRVSLPSIIHGAMARSHPVDIRGLGGVAWAERHLLPAAFGLILPVSVAANKAIILLLGLAALAAAPEAFRDWRRHDRRRPSAVG